LFLLVLDSDDLISPQFVELSVKPNAYEW
jgi:hypothetical protein